MRHTLTAASAINLHPVILPSTECSGERELVPAGTILGVLCGTPKRALVTAESLAGHRVYGWIWPDLVTEEYSE